MNNNLLPIAFFLDRQALSTAAQYARTELKYHSESADFKSNFLVVGIV